MKPIHRVLMLGALAVAVGLVGVQAARAALGRAATAQPVATPAADPLTTLLTTSSTDDDSSITPTGIDGPLGRPPVSQPIPNPVFN